MDISFYFEPVNTEKIITNESLHPRQMLNIMQVYKQESAFPSLENTHIAILGVNEDRLSSGNYGCAKAPDQIRKHFYTLFQPPYEVMIADLGNIKQGNRVEDTYFAVRDVVANLLKQNIIPFIIGGSQDITYANYLAYESLGKIINIASIDPSFDLGNEEDLVTSTTYLRKIITHQPSFLFNYTNIGYQSYFVDYEAVELMKKLYFDTYRLGVVQSNIEEVEPMVRNADMLTVDISAVRYSDAPCNKNASPNGFYGEELCRIMRYAGLSDKLTSAGIYEINPDAGNYHGPTSFLAAQALWYFVDGYYNRKYDFPIKDKKQYIKYNVMIRELNDDIVFYKSRKSDRWWMEVPCPPKLKAKLERHYLVPCSYKDYSLAMKEEIPDRWWQAYQKIM